MIAVDHTYVWDTREREAEQKRVGWKETYLFPIYVIKVILCKLLLHNLFSARH